MKRKNLTFIALAVTILFGVSFTLFSDGPPQGYAPVGGAIVALAWISIGFFGRDDGTDKKS